VKGFVSGYFLFFLIQRISSLFLVKAGTRIPGVRREKPYRLGKIPFKEKFRQQFGAPASLAWKWYRFLKNGLSLLATKKSPLPILREGKKRKKERCLESAPAYRWGDRTGKNWPRTSRKWEIEDMSTKGFLSQEKADNSLEVTSRPHRSAKIRADFQRFNQ